MHLSNFLLRFSNSFLSMSGSTMNSGLFEKDFRRIELTSAGETVEQRSIHLLQQLKDGKIAISDLMGPLSGLPELSPEINIPAGKSEPFPSAPDAAFSPNDASNTQLIAHVHPVDYVNPEPAEEPYDLVAIGAGVSGLISVIMGAWLGKRCALIERHAMGGDCLNIGCVPSKAVIACARAFHNAKHNMKAFGVSIEGSISIDFGFVMQRMREIRANISHHDSVQRYSREFCEHVYVGGAKFTGGDSIEVIGDDGTVRTLKFKKAMIATGASAAIPPVPGLREVPHLTNSNVFNLEELPEEMIVIGCGPIGLELSQSMARFGAKVHCLEMGPQLLMREDPDAAQLLEKQLREDGLEIHLSTKILNVEYTPADGSSDSIACYRAPWGTYTVTIEDKDGNKKTLKAAALLNATGRVPNVADIGLEKVGVSWDNRKGVHVNDYFQTNNPNIYACGDCTSPFKFTHAADFQARAAVRNMFLGEVSKSSDLLIPWCTYTEPEIAHVGKYEAELKAAGVEFETFTRQLAPVDRCMCEGVKDGFVKITVRAGTGQIIGATICGPNAGDMITELTICMQHGITVPQIAGTIHPYPTTQEAIRQACLGYNKYYKDTAGVPLATLKLLMAEKDATDEGKEAVGK